MLCENYHVLVIKVTLPPQKALLDFNKNQLLFVLLGFGNKGTNSCNNELQFQSNQESHHASKTTARR